MQNKEDDINVALIFVNTSAIGTVYEKSQVDSVLGGLKMPYKIITNANNLNKSEDFILSQDNNLLIGVNLFSSNNSISQIIKIESLNMVAEEQDLISSDKVYLFTSNSLSSTQNSTYLLNQFKNKYVFSFYPTENKFSAQTNPLTEVIEIGIPPSVTNEEINFYLIKEEADTITIFKRSDKSELSEKLYSIFLHDLKKLNLLIEEQTINSSLSNTFEIEFQSSTTTQNIVSDNRIYTILDNGLIYLNDYRGKENFVTEIIGNINSTPALYKDLILAATFEGDLYSINSNNGEVLQVVGIGENITSNISLSELEIQNSKKIGGLLGTIEGNIFCYDAFTFEQLWKNNISKSPIVSQPLVVNDKVIFINSSSSLYCVNLKSGSINWKYEFADKQNFPQSCWPLSDGKNVFAFTPDGNLMAIDLLLGKKNWSINLKGKLNQFYISSDKAKLFLIDNKGLLTIFSAKDGKEIGKIDFKKSNLFSFIITEMQDRTLVGFSDGSLYSLNSKLTEQQLISSDQIPITSINAINNDEFTIKNIFGKIAFYKIK
ncbi:MAG: PQQ-binding-like beta-propeller repeat protein [Ignavibacteriales bacterium]|nr:PQQ-binding-like beta-propeller repeat protein [Ignavibacteriales bacterium]